MTYEEFWKAVTAAVTPDWDGRLVETWTPWPKSCGGCTEPGEDEPELSELDEALEAVVPGITVLQYRRLVRSVVSYKRVERMRGYCDEHMEKFVRLPWLCECLVRQGLIEGGCEHEWKAAERERWQDPAKECTKCKLVLVER